MRDAFARFARKTSNAIGSPFSFAFAFATVLVWAACGPMFHFSETWQLVINTGTTIVTFLVVFMIQSTQNRDSKAVHLKLDELIHVISQARNSLIDCEDLPDAELEKLDREFQKLRNETAEGDSEPIGTKIAHQRKKR